MFPLLKYPHPLRYMAADVLIHLLCFAAIVALIVFALRGPLRKYKPADLHFFTRLQKLHSARMNSIMKALTFFAKHQFLIPATLIPVAAFYFTGHSFYAFTLFTVSLSSLLLMFMLKHLFHRKRPATPLLFEARGLSFPSGHAIMAVCFYGTLIWMLSHSDISQTSKIIFTILGVMLIISIGFSRVYLQVHYLSDVLAGFVIGSAWLYVALHALAAARLLTTM